MERQPPNPEFRINPENFHPWGHDVAPKFYHGILKKNLIGK